MSETIDARSLLSLLVVENETTHKECSKALNWLGESQPRRPSGSPVEENERTHASTPPIGRRPSERADSSIPLSEGLDDWLASRSDPASNWFVLKGAAYQEHLSSLGEAIQITVDHVLPAHPGAYEMGGLWRIRPGVNVSLYFPANFDPDDRFATVASKVTYRNTEKYYQLSASSLTTSLDHLLRDLIEGKEP